MAVVLNWLQWWGLDVVVLKGGCAFWVIPDCCDRSCYALALLGGCFAHFNVIPGLTGYLVLCLGGWDAVSEMLLL